jgi:uncharacterized protein
MDTDVLADIVPGISQLELIEEHTYKAIAQIKLGPVSGSFTGSLELQDIVQNQGYTLHVKQNSKIGNADALIKIALVALNESETEVSFEGNAKLSGLLASTGQRVLSGVASTLSRQFFENFEEALDGN